MKKFIMMAMITGALACFGSPCGGPYEPPQYFVEHDNNGNTYLSGHSETGIWQVTLDYAIKGRQIDLVKQLLDAGAKNHDGYKIAIYLANHYLAIAKMIKDSEEKHGNEKNKEEK